MSKEKFFDTAKELVEVSMEHLSDDQLRAKVAAMSQKQNAQTD